MGHRPVVVLMPIPQTLNLMIKIFQVVFLSRLKEELQNIV